MTEAPDLPSPPLSPHQLVSLLREMGIPHEVHRHPPVFTVEEAQAHKGDLPGAHTKNLFLRDRRGRMWILVALHDRAIDLLSVGRAMKERGLVSGRLSFGSRERLLNHLGIHPGAVSPFALVNDREKAVRIALDRGLESLDIWNAHPLTNEMTVALEREAMLRFLSALGREPVWLDL